MCGDDFVIRLAAPCEYSAVEVEIPTFRLHQHTSVLVGSGLDNGESSVYAVSTLQASDPDVVELELPERFPVEIGVNSKVNSLVIESSHKYVTSSRDTFPRPLAQHCETRS